MRRSRVVALVLVVIASSCGDGDPDDVAAETSAGTARSIDATTAGTVVPQSSSTPSTAVASSVAGVVPVGFGTIAGRVTAPDGEICELCLWLADDEATRGRGLMQVTDLGGLDGMVFLYEAPHTTSFTMRNTVMPLSIAFFGADGTLLDAFDMEPCDAEPCPSYPTPTDFVVAIELPQGELADLGIGAGSTLELVAELCT